MTALTPSIYCWCPCHDQHAIGRIPQHLTPCCEDCPYCKKRIKLTSFDDHVITCPKGPVANDNAAKESA